MVVDALKVTDGTVVAMRFFVLSGGDDQAVRLRREELLDGVVDLEHLDCREEGGAALLLDALGAASLFGGARSVAAEGIEALDEETLGRIEQLAEGSDALVVARSGGTIAPKLKKRLSAIATVEKFDVPRPRDVPARIDALARKVEVRLSRDAREMLVARCGHDLERAQSVLQSCSLAGVAQPTARQVSVLCGTASAPGVPWELTDALEAGDARRSLEAAVGLEPVLVASYLSKRFSDTARLAESGTVDAASAKALGTNPMAADRLVRLALRLGPLGARRSLIVLRGVDRRVKFSHGAERAQGTIDLTVKQLINLVG